MNIFTNRIDAEKMLSVQNVQYSEILYLADSVEASTQKVGKVNVSNLGHFYCMFITGSFSTLYNNGGNAADAGISYLRGKLVDGANQRQLFNDYIPLSLLLSPGRRRQSSAVGDPSNTLFYPVPFEYLFTANSDIILDVKNDSDFINYYSIAFHGVRVKSSAAVKGI